MSSLLANLLPVLVLFATGAIGGRTGLVSEELVEGLKRLVTKLTLPLLLFSAFAGTKVEPSFLFLAAAVFVACAFMGLAGRLLAKPLRLPLPIVAFLFQGFEAGMLGYALYSSFFGTSNVSRFAVADLGQGIYVFTVLMAQMTRPAESALKGGKSRLGLILVSLFTNPVMLAIFAGLLVSAIFGQSHNLPWGAEGLFGKTFSLLGGLTTPLVCITVGYGLKAGFGGGRAAVTATISRMALALCLGLLLGYVLLPALGMPRDYAAGVVVLFLLPPPFVVSIYRRDKKEAGFISSVLSLHTVASLVAVVLFAALAGGSL